MAKLRKKKALASSAEDVAAIEAQTAAMVEETKAIEAEIRAEAKALLRDAKAKAALEMEHETQLTAQPVMPQAGEVGPLAVLVFEPDIVSGIPHLRIRRRLRSDSLAFAAFLHERSV
jgi:hypothetical protein